MTEEALFDLALDTPAADRAALLDRECAGDPALRARVEALLRADALPDPTLTHPGEKLGDRTASYSPPIGTPGVVVGGKYKLVEPIGEGGMGSVWLAHQTEPVKRKVAVKLIKAGMDSKAVIARFEAERQALAVMDHPNIAKILDGGLHDGRPYFVMELVKGVPITDFCDARRLTPRQRLELFVPVCQAIQHAHQKGIIHRDIKPNNVLVALYDDKPVPKVIDFGLAKATGGGLSDLSATGFGGVVVTPQYMSPEQASLNNLDIDTRSDVYSLGVLLYELLAGSPPFKSEELREAGLMEMLRVVREDAPPKPSTKLSTADALPSLSARRGTEPKKLTALLRSELDWIVMKALEKDRARRYETANGFAADVNRYLANEPVLARSPSSLYRLRKAWQRNKLAAAAVAAVAAALVLGVAVSTWQAVRASREAARAETEASRVVVALDALRDTAPAFAAQARTLTAREQFAEAIDKLDYAAKLRPEQADYLVTKGNLLQCQFRLAEAARVYRAALELLPDDPAVRANLELCDELHAASAATGGKLSREQLSQLLLAMQREQRSAAELMPASRLLGDEKKLVLAYWLERLKDLPISADKPLAQRLTVRDDGMLALDLSHTKVTDLSLLAGAPLAVFNASEAKELTDIAALRGMKLVDLNLASTKVSDLSPLDRMSSLENLRLDSTPVTDIRPLEGIRLKLLSLNNCAVRDISPVRTAALEKLYIVDTRVTDISPLAGMPLKILDMGAAPVADFTPLTGLPLELCSFSNCQVSDLSFLRGSPLKELLLWQCPSARNYAALSHIKTLELLILPETYDTLAQSDLDAIELLRLLPKLRQLGTATRFKYTTTGSAKDFWQKWDREKEYFSALNKSGFRYCLYKYPEGTYGLDLRDQPFIDLSLLKGIPIARLWLNGCKVTDLSPLRGMPLVELGLYGNPVEDLTPLSGLPLDNLSLDETNVSDLSPLRSLKLNKLYTHNCLRLTDITPLLTMPLLQTVTIPILSHDVERLRHITNIKYLSYSMMDKAPWLPTTTAEQFWREYGQLAWVRTIQRSGLKPRALLQMSDGTWKLDLNQSSVKDLEFLKGANISDLCFSETEVADLSPLRGMPLTHLQMFQTNVVDLEPLQGMSIRRLNMFGCHVTNLSSLRKLPLISLRLHECHHLTDVSPLKDVKTLRELTLPLGAKDFDFLRDMPALERLSYTEDLEKGYRVDMTAAEFWRTRDDLKAANRIPPNQEGLAPDATTKRRLELAGSLEFAPPPREQN